MEPARPTHPGRILKREMVARGWSQLETAARMNRPAQVVNEIVSGKKTITAHTAIQLGQVFGTTAEFWWELQCTYELRVAQLEAGEVAP